MPVIRHQFCLLLLLLLGTLVVPIRAGGSSENAVMIVDPSSAEAMYVANHYAWARSMPGRNLIYAAPGASSFQEFAAVNAPALFGEIAGRGIEDHIDFVVIPPGGSFFISAPGLITDSCSPVNRLSMGSAYGLSYRTGDILSGLASTTINEFADFTWTGVDFDSGTDWYRGQPSTSFQAKRYFIGSMLGYSGSRGNTVAEIIQMIDRSVAADGTMPVGTFYYMQTTDPLRSGPRHGFYPTALTQMALAGGMAQHLFADLPLGAQDCLGVMTGVAGPSIDSGNFTLLPGSFCDHLTSYAGTFDSGSQVKMSRWIAKGASGTAGTVEEPCNYAGKFPHALMHVVYRQGLTLGEAWLRSHGYEPYQSLLLGDPLTRPFAAPPTVLVTGIPSAPVAGILTLGISAVATAPGAVVTSIEVLVDGVVNASVPVGQAFVLDTGTLDDGWHDFRVRAFDDTPVRNVGRWIGSLNVSNTGLRVGLTANTQAGDLSQRFDLSFSASGAPGGEVRILQNDRVVVAAQGSASGILSVYGQNLGAGNVRLVAEVDFTNGSKVRSQPVELGILFNALPASGVAPVAHGFTRTAFTGTPFVLELPASYDDDPSLATYTVLQRPSQATILSSGAGPYRVLSPTAAGPGVDGLTFRVDTPSGSSNVATVTIVYVDPPPSPGGIQLSGVSPPVVDALIPGTDQTVTVTGTGFTSSTTVEVDGQPLSGTPLPYTIVDQTRITLDMPQVPTLGAHVITVRDGPDSDSTTVQVVAPAVPALQAASGDANAVVFQAAGLDLTVSGTVASVHLVAFSTSSAPSAVPGVITMGLGNGFQQIWSAGTLSIPPAGWATTNIPISGIPPLSRFYLQGIELGPNLPFATSNLQQIVVLF